MRYSLQQWSAYGRRIAMIHQHFNVEKEDYANAGRISSQIKQMLKQLGVSSEVLRRIAISCYEAEINMIIHSYGGEVVLTLSAEGKCELRFSDMGPGIDDIEKAMTPGWSTAKASAREFGFGAGMGLPNIKRNCDEFDLVTSPAGTTLVIGFKVL
ncbi:MAG: ATP-binding protein [Erysipelotrichaceae bacterium]|nr:ATP-binding protein [Erysipelotrichaceae bacterium]